MEAVTDLVQKIKSNNKEAFKTFFKFFQPEVFNFLYKYTYDYDCAKDLTQETFIKFWEARERIDETRNSKSYLFKIAKNLALNYFESKKNFQRIEDFDQLDNSQSMEAIDYNFLLKDYEKAILKLPERCRVILILSRYHDFKYEEIAEILDISLQTVKNQMNKTLSILRESLSNYKN